MEAARALKASGATASMVTSVRDLTASGVTAAISIADGDGSWLAAARIGALDTAAERATSVGGSNRGQSAVARAAAWLALVGQSQQGWHHEGLWF